MRLFEKWGTRCTYISTLLRSPSFFEFKEKTDGGSNEGDGEAGCGGGSVSDNEVVKSDAGSRISNDDAEVQLSTDNSTIGFSTGESTPQAIADEPFSVRKTSQRSFGSQPLFWS